MGAAEDGTRSQSGAPVSRAEETPPPPPSRAVVLSPGAPLETVCGEPLEEGERVLLYFAPSHRAAKCAYIAVGVLLAVVVFGLVLIAYGVMYDRWHLRFVAITDRRLIVKKGERPARWLRLREVVDLRARRGEHGAGVTKETALASAKTEPRFWEGADAVIVQGKVGALSIDRSVAPTLVGPAIARAIDDPAWLERLPSANHPR